MTVSATVWETVWETVCRTVWLIALVIAQAGWVTGIDARAIGPGNQRIPGEGRTAAEAVLAALLLAALHHLDGARLPGEALRPGSPLHVAMSDLRGLDHPLGEISKFEEDLGRHSTETEDSAVTAHH